MTQATLHLTRLPLPAGHADHGGPVAAPLSRTPLAGPHEARRNPLSAIPPGPVARVGARPRGAVATADRVQPATAVCDAGLGGPLSLDQTPPGPVARALLPRAAVAVALGKPGRDGVVDARPRRAPHVDPDFQDNAAARRASTHSLAFLFGDCGHPWPGFDGLVLALLVATVLACWSQGDLYQRALRAPRPPITRVWRGARKDG